VPDFYGARGLTWQKLTGETECGEEEGKRTADREEKHMETLLETRMERIPRKGKRAQVLVGGGWLCGVEWTRGDAKPGKGGRKGATPRKRKKNAYMMGGTKK